MDIKIFQSNKETYFWTKDEIDEISKICPDFLYEKTYKSYELNFEWKGHNIIIARNFEEDFKEKKFNLIKGVNVIIIYPDIKFWFDINTIDELTNISDDYKFIIVDKNIEDYWMSYENRTDDAILKMFSKKNNIKVIWDSCYGNYNNFYFEPKVHIQNYYNNNHFLGSIFFNGKQIYHDSKDKKRIGVHFNKLADKTRINLSNELKTFNDDNLFFTINKDCHYNNTFFKCDVGNYQSVTFQNNLKNSSLPIDFYVDQFVNLTIKSEVEIIYETFTTDSSLLNCVKWNEKTIKHLFLGKPFIHMDPYAHKLMTINGYTPYKPLFTDELWNLYENSDINNILTPERTTYWIPALINNIKWLLSLDEYEWNKRINESYVIAEKNVKVTHNLIFNTSLFNYIDNVI
jgi:hypothetical protein